MAKISFKNVKKIFKDFELPIINFELVEGDRLAISGKSGSGKSTIVNLLLGLLEADSGTIERNYSKASVVFQEDRLIQEISAHRNLDIIPFSNSIQIKEMLEVFEIPQTDQKVTEFSGGMKRRLALARALLFDGDILILDEPFTGLDGEIRDKSIRNIKKYWGEKPIIIISHNSKDFIDFECNKFLDLSINTASE